MANKIKGGPSEVGGDVPSAKDTKTVTLTFIGAAEVALYNRLAEEAETDERTLSRFLVRKLKSVSPAPTQAPSE